MSNLTVHPASVNTRIPNREAVYNSGTMCSTSIVGRPGIMMLHMCVDITCRPSANGTFSVHVVFCLLWTGMPSMTKIWVAPESVIASFDAIVIAAYAHFDSCLGANDENADSRFFIGCVCWSPNWNEPRSGLGIPKLGILTGTNSEIPKPLQGLLFGVFFSHAQDRPFLHKN
jgi:hypothetical protein